MQVFLKKHMQVVTDVAKPGSSENICKPNCGRDESERGICALIILTAEGPTIDI